MDVLIELQFLGKIILAAFFGGVVGLEREFAEKPAGLRTHMLVGATSALFVVLAQQIVSSLFDRQEIISTDPIRILQAIVVGISFLGAGTILKYRHDDQRMVEGLATSASLLSVSAIGVAVALNSFILAIGVALLDLFINRGLVYWVDRLKSKTE